MAFPIQHYHAQLLACLHALWTKPCESLSEFCRPTRIVPQRLSPRAARLRSFRVLSVYLVSVQLSRVAYAILLHLRISHLIETADRRPDR